MGLDWDPEIDQHSSDEYNSDQDLDQTEHYLKVDKSKLRNKLDIPLDSKYKAKKVTRTDLKDSDEDLGLIFRV